MEDEALEKVEKTEGKENKKQMRKKLRTKWKKK